MTRERIGELLHRKGSCRYIVAREQHASGKYHFHALAYWPEKHQFRDPRHFDVDCPHCEGGHHPNIQARGKKTNEWDRHKFEYCLKDDFEPLMSANFLSPFLKNSKGFTKSWQDHQNWMQQIHAAKLKNVEEFKFPEGGPVSHWEMSKGPRRMSLIVIHGEPGCGKTKWIQNTFAGYRIFYRNNHQYPYDKYNGQNLIIWDDVGTEIKPEEIISCLNYYQAGQTHVWGSTRYQNTYWPNNQQRTIIWLMNTDIMNNKWKPHVLDDPRITGKKGRCKYIWEMTAPAIIAGMECESDDEMLIVKT